MVVWRLGRVVRGVFDALVRPRQFVAAQTSAYSVTGTGKLNQTASLLVVYIVNLLTYAGPLTIAGFGVPESAGEPPAVVAAAGTVLGSPETLWRFLLGFVQNSSYITALAVVTLVTYHLGVIATRNSAGFLQSLHTVVYSTSAYLAGLFTVVWYLTTTEGVAHARDLVLNLQQAGVYAIIDAVNSDLQLPGGRPEQILTGELTQLGTVLVAILCLLVLYYLYSLYLGARMNHRTDRLGGLLVVVAVCLAPVVYILGSIVINLVGGQLVV